MIRSADIPLLARWVAARLRILLRGPRGAFFTFIFPMIFLVIFDAANSGSTLKVTGGRVNFAQFYTPGIAVFAVTTSCYQGLIILVANLRHQGILKRVRGTPLPPWIYLTALVMAAILAALMSVLLMFVVAVPAFGFHIYWKLVPAAIVTLLVGAAAITAIALSVSCFVDRPETAQPLAGLTLFPLLFVSGVFYPLEGAPDWLQKVAHFFPLSHLAQGFEQCFSPHTTGLGFSGAHLGVLAAWWAAGTFYAARHFRWEKRPGGGGVFTRRRPQPESAG
ncbi:MAG TPA: ABC transporter permease [Thermoleophilaceae bacterium]